MESLHAEYKAGDKLALALAIYGCALLRKPLPPWVAEAWMDGWVRASMRVADWNDLLGKVKVMPAGKRKKQQEKMQLAAKLAHLIPSVRAIPIARDLDRGKFAALSKLSGYTPRQIKDVYYHLSPLITRRRQVSKK